MREGMTHMRANWLHLRPLGTDQCLGRVNNPLPAVPRRTLAVDEARRIAANIAKLPTRHGADGVAF